MDSLILTCLLTSAHIVHIIFSFIHFTSLLYVSIGSLWLLVAGLGNYIYMCSLGNSGNFAMEAHLKDAVFLLVFEDPIYLGCEGGGPNWAGPTGHLRSDQSPSRQYHQKAWSVLRYQEHQAHWISGAAGPLLHHGVWCFGVYMPTTPSLHAQCCT